MFYEQQLNVDCVLIFLGDICVSESWGCPKTGIFPLNALIQWEVFSHFGASSGTAHIISIQTIGDPWKELRIIIPNKTQEQKHAPYPRIQERTAYPLGSLPEMVRSTHFIPGYIYNDILIYISLYIYIYHLYRLLSCCVLPIRRCKSHRDFHGLTQLLVVCAKIAGQTHEKLLRNRELFGLRCRSSSGIHCLKEFFAWESIRKRPPSWEYHPPDTGLFYNFLVLQPAWKIPKCTVVIHHPKYG